jgi:glycosyltransferase involved in cell wall biosynthesis
MARASKSSEPQSPAVSVIMPLYNCERYVAEALESALAQTFKDFEVIVVDDGSADGGAAVVEGYAANDARIKLIRQSNKGISIARNVAISRATGYAIAFLDPDDLWFPTKLEVQLPLLTNTNVVYGAEFRIWEDDPDRVEGPSKVVDQIGIRDPLRCLMRTNSVWGPNMVMVSRALLAKQGGFDEGLRQAEDIDLWLRLASDGAHFCHVSEPLGKYRIRTGSLSADGVSQARARVRVYEKLVAQNAGASLGKRLAVRAGLEQVRHRLSRELRGRGYALITAGKTAEGRRDLRSSIAAAPLWWRSWVSAGVLIMPGLPRVVFALGAERYLALDARDSGRTAA